MITINWDFTTGKEVSFAEGLELKDNFETCCLEFFGFYFYPHQEVIVVCKDGKKISRNDIQSHTLKEIRPEHDLHKMLIAGSFKFL